MKRTIAAGLLGGIIALVGVSLMAPRDGSGSYSLPAGNPVSTGTTINSTVHNTTMSDVATALSASIARDGQTTATANLPMGTFRHTNVGNASARNHYAATGQVQDWSMQTLGSVAGTNTITGNLNPAITAYAAGMVITFQPANSSTGAVTLAVNGLTALDVLKADGDALVSGDLVVGIPAVLVLDTGADDWILLNPQATFAQLSQSNVFTGAEQQINAANAFLSIRDTGAAVDEKHYYIQSTAGELRIGTLTDAAGAGSIAIAANRTGTTVDTINLQATSVQANGVAVATAATGSFTGTLTGMTGSTTGTVSYRVVGNVCHLWITSQLVGTSNSALMTMTGIPAACTPANAKFVHSVVQDNGLLFPGATTISAASVLSFYIFNGTSLSSSVFTTSGSKGLPSAWSISYALD